MSEGLYRAHDITDADQRGRSLITPQAWLTASELLQLSPREMEIANCIFDEKSTKEIAKSLGISVHTVQSHLERLYRKLGVCSRVGLVLRIVAVSQSLPGCDPSVK
jgi:DNA-binding CsgD family transcriptional regulator